jgi:DNA-binding MarR family transcriptional regulator
LEKSGLIVGGKGEDQRTHVVSLTLKGRTAMEKAFPMWRKVQCHVATTLGPKRLEHLLSDLKEAVVLLRDS